MVQQHAAGWSHWGGGHIQTLELERPDYVYPDSYKDFHGYRITIEPMTLEEIQQVWPPEEHIDVVE
jgi:hypothetical protein